MKSILNIAAYRFVPLTGLPTLQTLLTEQAAAQGLAGTVLLAEEGINLFLAGDANALRAWLAWLHQLRLDDGTLPFEGLRAKESWSETVPFRKLRIRIKREIIRMNMPAIVPAAGRAPAVPAATLKRWLDAGYDDEGRPVVTLDTRNRFEVDAGRFIGAIDWNLEKFSEFPAALEAHAAELRDKTVVSFCTGGIRCEKAALVMQQAGLTHAYQLEGGILQYFEDEPGAPHWEGRCVVFDDRQALEADLSPAAGASPRTGTPRTPPTH